MIIVNSTPLINFSAIQRLDILKQLFKKIYIPSAVQKELLIDGNAYPNAEVIRNADFIVVKPIETKDKRLVDTLKMNLDEGESEVIALALERNANLIILDEIAGRNIAESYSIPLTGSIGCLMEAKNRGIISKIKPLLDRMQTEAGFWIHPKLYSRVLKDNDEF